MGSQYKRQTFQDIDKAEASGAIVASLQIPLNSEIVFRAKRLSLELNPHVFLTFSQGKHFPWCTLAVGSLVTSAVDPRAG